MAQFDLSAASNTLKVRYIGNIREQLNNATVLLKLIQRQDQAVSGKSFTVPLHTDRNASAMTGVADFGTLPTAGVQSYQTTIVPNAYSYGRITVTGPTIAASRDNLGAFVDALNSEVDGLMRDSKRALNRQLHSDGTDALWVQNEAGNTPPIDLDDGQGNNFGHFVGTLDIDILDAPSTYAVLGTGPNVTIAKNSSGVYQVTAVNSGTYSALAADGDLIIRKGTRGLQMMGIRGIIAASDPPLGSLQGLASTNDFWNAQVFGNSGTLRALAFEDMQEVIDAIATNSDYQESDIKAILCGYPVRRSYYKLCIAERRHVNTMELDGGFSALDFNGIGLVADSQCRRNVMYFLVPDTMRIFRTADFDWLDKDGSYLSRVADKDAYEATLFAYQNLACLSRNGNGLLSDLIEN